MNVIPVHCMFVDEVVKSHLSDSGVRSPKSGALTTRREIRRARYDENLHWDVGGRRPAERRKSPVAIPDAIASAALGVPGPEKGHVNANPILQHPRRRTAAEQERPTVEAPAGKRGREWPPELQAQVLDRYAAGESGPAIAEALGGDAVAGVWAAGGVRRGAHELAGQAGG